MPSNYVRDEAAWNKAKEIASQEGKSGDYAYITGIYKNMKGLSKKSPVETLDINVVTSGEEDVLEAIGSLKESLENYILDVCVPDLLRESYWVCVENLTESEAVAEVKGGSECLYYKVSFTRDESGVYSFGEPVKVEEVTTYEPSPVPEVASPPTEMARAVLCESMAIHAPPAEGLTKGRSVQILRLGSLYDVDSGDFVLDVTEELCKEIMLSASAVGYGVPIDFGHGLYKAQVSGKPQEDVSMYGRFSELEFKPGEGLFGVPEWTNDGIDLLKKNPGLLYLSPTLMGTPFNPDTGEQMSGRGLHSVSITPTPRQNNMSSLALSKEVSLPDAKLPTKDVITLSKSDHTALLDRVAGAERRVVELAAQLEGKSTEVTELSKKIESYVVAEKAREFNDLILSFDAKGVIVSEDLRTTLASLPIEQSTLILSQIPATRPITSIGSGGIVEPKEPKTDVEIAKEAHIIMEAARRDGKTVSFQEAVRLAKGA